MTASIFPSKPIGSVSPTVLKTFNFLKTLPEGYKIWHNLAIWRDDLPDFLVLNPHNQATIIKVCNATLKQFKSRLQMILIGDENEEIGKREEEILENFIQEVGCRLVSFERWDDLLQGVLLFPNITSKQVSQCKPRKENNQNIWLGADYLSSSKIKDWQNVFPSQSLDAISYQHIRKIFTPETVVPNSLTVRKPKDRNTKAGLDDFLLDYDQENILKQDLKLPEQTAKLSQDFQVSLVNGVAGSGKTIILLYRLRLLHELYPNKQFLVLTHNRALIKDIQWKYYQLCGDLPKNIEWRYFYSWLGKQLRKGPFLDAVGKYLKEKIIQRIRLEIFNNMSITNGMLISEIDWINDQIDRSREGYLSADRRGRGFRLSQNQRDLMYDAYEEYLAKLGEISKTDWGLIPHLAWEYFQKGMNNLPKYDAVFIDEAQFFAPIWFEIVRAILKPQTGHLFMVADPTQGFLNRGTSWKSMGVEVRGRTEKLKKSYRMTKEIMNLAIIFYRQRVPQDHMDEEVLEPDTQNLPDGVVPQLIQVKSYQDEIARVTNEIERFVTKFSIPKKHILVIHANWRGANYILKSINKRLGENSAKKPENHAPGNYIRRDKFE